MFFDDLKHLCHKYAKKKRKNPKEKTTQIMKVANSFSLRCKFFEYVLVCRWMGTASIVVHMCVHADS